MSWYWSKNRRRTRRLRKKHGATQNVRAGGGYRARLPGLTDWVISRYEKGSQREGFDEAVSREMNAVARAIFYPYRWNREHALKPSIVQHMIECEGVTEADIRDMRYLVNRDAIVVRLWNWRKFQIDGIHQHNHDVRLSRGRLF